MTVKEGKRRHDSEAVQSQRHLGELDRRGIEINAVDTQLQYHSTDNVRPSSCLATIGHPGACARRGMAARSAAIRFTSGEVYLSPASISASAVALSTLSDNQSTRLIRKWPLPIAGSPILRSSSRVAGSSAASASPQVPAATAAAKSAMRLSTKGPTAGSMMRPTRSSGVY